MKSITHAYKGFEYPDNKDWLNRRGTSFFLVTLAEDEAHIGPSIFVSYPELVVWAHSKAKTIERLLELKWIKYSKNPPIGARSWKMSASEN